LSDFETRPDFTPAEKAALRLAERMTRDAHQVSNELWTELRRHFDEGELVELAAAIGLFNYFNRFNDALRIEPTRQGSEFEHSEL
jgi:alkylhydroperoxidase family enzyme